MRAVDDLNCAERSRVVTSHLTAVNAITGRMSAPIDPISWSVRKEVMGKGKFAPTMLLLLSTAHSTVCGRIHDPDHSVDNCPSNSNAYHMLSSEKRGVLHPV